MASGMIDVIKQVTMNVVDNNQMCDLRFGKVISTNPLKVRVTNQFTIPKELLIVPEHLTDYTKKVSFDWATDYVDAHTHSYSDGTTNSANRHNHQIKSSKNKTITIHNALQVGDKVALLRKQGGQSYYILDRV